MCGVGWYGAAEETKGILYSLIYLPVYAFNTFLY